MRLETGIDDQRSEYVRLHGAEHRIERAYCTNLAETMEVFWARNAYWAQPPGARRRFRFECPDDECRERFHPTIGGVNYDKLVNDRDLENHLRAPHFRWIEAAVHAPTCQLVVDALARAEVAKETPPAAVADDASGERLTAYKATDYVNVFVVEPPKRSATVSASAGSGAPSGVSSGERRRSLIVARKAALRAHLTESRVLQSVVSCYQRLAVARTADKAKLRIGGVWGSYYDWFQPMAKAAVQDWKRIWNGGGSVRRYGDRYSVLFYDDFALGDGRRAPLRLALAVTDLDASRDGRYYREVFDAALATPGGYVTCWLYGRIARSGDSVGFDVDDVSDMVFAQTASRAAKAASAVGP